MKKMSKRERNLINRLEHKRIEREMKDKEKIEEIEKRKEQRLSKEARVAGRKIAKETTQILNPIINVDSQNNLTTKMKNYINRRNTQELEEKNKQRYIKEVNRQQEWKNSLKVEKIDEKERTINESLKKQKLILPDSCYEGIEGARKISKEEYDRKYNTPEHKKLIKETDERIRQGQLRQAKSIADARNFVALNKEER